MLVRTKLHLQIVESVLELLQQGGTLRALIIGRVRAEDQSAFPAVAEVKYLILQFLQLVVLEPHSFANRTIVDIELVPHHGDQVYGAFRAFHFKSPAITSASIGRSQLRRVFPAAVPQAARRSD